MVSSLMSDDVNFGPSWLVGWLGWFGFRAEFVVVAEV